MGLNQIMSFSKIRMHAHIFIYTVRRRHHCLPSCRKQVTMEPWHSLSLGHTVREVRNDHWVNHMPQNPLAFYQSMQQRKLNRMIEIKNWCQLGRTKLSVEEAGCSLILNEAISLLAKCRGKT